MSGRTQEGQKSPSHLNFLVVQSVYRDVWDEYHTASAAFSQRMLESLACKTPSDLPEEDYGLDVNEDSHDFGPSVSLCADDPNDLNTFDAFDVYTFSLGSPSTSTHARVHVRRPSTPGDIFTESASYEFCQTTSWNIRHGDDPNDTPFIPLADDPEFDSRAYMLEHQRNSWQSEVQDIWVVVETAYRLVHDHGMTLEDIDRCGALPLPICSAESQESALERASRSDPPPWFDHAPTALVELQKYGCHPPASDDLTGRLQSLLSSFCSNLNCTEAHCWTHDGEIHCFESDPRYAQPAMTYIPRASKPCGETCYLLINVIQPKTFILRDQEVRDLETVFRISPEGTSCEVAALMHLPCCSVYQQRVAFASKCREQVKAEAAARPSLVTNECTTESCPDDSGSSKPVLATHFEPCSHRGRCGPSAHRCTCYTNNTPCERTCCCPADCRRRWRGCDCASNRGRKLNLCTGSHSCPCQRAGRECDPEICDCVHSTEEDVACKNVEIRQQCGKDISVARSAFGLGAFLQEPVREGEFICEYVGELIYEDTTNTRDMLVRHRGRGYVFGLDDAFDIDALRAGNVARFINHAPTRISNCATRVKNVSGDYRIGFYAKRWLPAGTELTFDYGPEFFRQHPVSEPHMRSSSPKPEPATKEPSSRGHLSHPNRRELSPIRAAKKTLPYAISRQADPRKRSASSPPLRAAKKTLTYEHAMRNKPQEQSPPLGVRAAKKTSTAVYRQPSPAEPHAQSSSRIIS